MKIIKTYNLIVIPFYILLISFFNFLVSEQYTQEPFVTNRRVPDGFGSQFQDIIASALYAEFSNKPFLYSPFIKMDHNYDNDSDFINKKEHLINFLGNFDLCTFPSSTLRPGYKDFLDQNIDLVITSKTLKNIKHIFRQNKKIEHFFDPSRFNIAIHVRRPNPHDTRPGGSDTPDTLFIDCINALREKYASNNPLFHIFSQGELESFTPYFADDVIIHLNDTIEYSFTSMVFADVLLVAQSSFSYAAALISNGKIYYIPFWHAPAPGWTSVEELIPDYYRDITTVLTDQENLITTILPQSLTLDEYTGKIIIPEDIKHIKLDIGLSYSAPMSQQWLTNENDLWVFGFEPNPTSIESILNGASRIDPSHGEPLETRFINDRFFLIPCALGISDEAMATFFVTKDCGCCSLFKPKEIELSETIQVPIFKLEDFFNIFPFDTHPVIDYIKIDAQGADLDIIKSAGAYLSKHVVFVTLEPEDLAYENTNNSSLEIREYFVSQGFIPYETPWTSDPTYLNSTYQEYATSNSIIIYQQG